MFSASHCLADLRHIATGRGRVLADDMEVDRDRGGSSSTEVALQEDLLFYFVLSEVSLISGDLLSRRMRCTASALEGG